MFQQLRQLRETTAAMPAVIANAHALRDAAQTYQRQSADAATSGMRADDPRLAPVAGVDLTTYARTVKAAVTSGRPAIEVAVENGVPADAWTEASTGWGQRMNGDMALAVEYGTVYSSVVL